MSVGCDEVRVPGKLVCRSAGGPSATTAMGFRLSTDGGGFALSPQEREELARRLDLQLRRPVLKALGKGSWHAIPAAMQLAIAEELHAPSPENPEHVAAGHRVAEQAAQQKDVVVERFRDQYLRYCCHTYLLSVDEAGSGNPDGEPTPVSG